MDAIKTYKKRPLFLILLGSVLILEPIFKLINFKFITSFSLATIISNVLSQENPVGIFEFWFLFPLAGVSLMIAKKWSYGVFMATQFYSIYSFLTYERFTWPFVSETPPIFSIIILILNISLIVFFSFPNTRMLFFDKKVRIWDTAKRYIVRFPVTVTLPQEEGYYVFEVVNISKSGIFVTGPCELSHFNFVNLNFHIDGINYELKGRVASTHIYKKTKGYGIQFYFKNQQEKNMVTKALKWVASYSKSETRIAFR